MANTLVIFIVSILLIGSATAIATANDEGITISQFNFDNISLFAGQSYTQNITITNTDSLSKRIIIYFQNEPTSVIYIFKNINITLLPNSEVTIPLTFTIANNSPRDSLSGNILFYEDKS